MESLNIKKIIIDTDPGHDDALAVLLLEKSALFDIQAVTTVAGNSSIQDTTNNAQYILDLVDSSAPLYSGATHSLSGDVVRAEVHGEGGLAGAQVSIQVDLTHNASEKIIDIVKQYPNEVTLLALGALTNIAQAFTMDPTLPSMVKEIIIMGGAINVPGNKNRVAEFNILVDPEAADIVFNANVKKVLVPLDACNHISFALADFDKLAGSLLYLPIKSMMEPYIIGIQTFEKDAGALMYDPLAAYYLINPDAYILVEMDVRIELNGTYTRGMTVADRRAWGDKTPNTLVVTSIDRESFVRDFFSILSK